MTLKNQPNEWEDELATILSKTKVEGEKMLRETIKALFRQKELLEVSDLHRVSEAELIDAIALLIANRERLAQLKLLRELQEHVIDSDSNYLDIGTIIEKAAQLEALTKGNTDV